MNKQPLNPVLSVKAEDLNRVRQQNQHQATYVAPPKQPASQPPQADKRTNVRLSMQEDFDLVSWLKAYQMQPGDTIDTLVLAARAALKNNKINYNHMQTRIVEFDIPVPRKSSNGPVMERLRALEVMLDAVIRDQIRVCQMAHINPSLEVVAYAKDRGIDLNYIK